MVANKQMGGRGGTGQPQQRVPAASAGPKVIKSDVGARPISFTRLILLGPPGTHIYDSLKTPLNRCVTAQFLNNGDQFTNI